MNKKLKVLLYKLIFIKKKEAEIKKNKLAIEDQIIKQFSDLPIEGSTTITDDMLTVTITTKLKRELDYEAYSKFNLPRNLTFVDSYMIIITKRLFFKRLC